VFIVYIVSRLKKKQAPDTQIYTHCASHDEAGTSYNKQGSETMQGLHLVNLTGCLVPGGG
jgi:hypothetical protein